MKGGNALILNNNINLGHATYDCAFCDFTAAMSGKWPDRTKIVEDEEQRRKRKQLLESRAAKAKEAIDKEHRRKHNIQEEEDGGGDEMVNNKSVSFLSSDAISWMNKHRPRAMNGLAQQSHLTPAQALHYRSIFKGLDFDGSGGISLEEMEEAISYVGKHEPGCVERPKEIMSVILLR